MGKPVNKIAIFVWIVAGLNALAQTIGEPILHYLTIQAAPEYQKSDAAVHLTMWLWHISNIRSGIVSTTLLIAVGAIVEILDAIRWNSLSPDKRKGH